MLKWIRSLFAAKPLPPLPKPWPTEDDVVREVVTSLTDQPSRWSYSPPTTTFLEYHSAILSHDGGVAAVGPSGSVFVRSRCVATDEAVAALFWQHPVVVAEKERAAEAAARPLAAAIQSLKPKES